MIIGRDKPHIYKHGGFWYARQQSHRTHWKWRKAVTYVESLNRAIHLKAETNEQAKQPDPSA